MTNERPGAPSRRTYLVILLGSLAATIVIYVLGVYWDEQRQAECRSQGGDRLVLIHGGRTMCLTYDGRVIWP